MNLPVKIEEINLENSATIYSPGGLDPFLQHIADQVSGEVPDLSTKKGRDRIASLAAQVSRSKTAVEKPGREYLKHLKALPKTVEQELKSFVDACDKLRDEIRKPLTEWENFERFRKQAHESAIASIHQRTQTEGNSDAIAEQIRAINEIVIDNRCEEYLSEYAKAKDGAIQTLNAKLEAQLKAEAQAAELEELRRLQAIRDQEERDKRIAQEAEERAKAEAQAALKRQEEEAARRELELRLEKEKAERLRVEAERRAEQAAAQERERIAKQQAEERAEAERQAADKEHRKAVNNEILTALCEAGLGEDDAKKVIFLAVKGQAGRLTIKY